MSTTAIRSLSLHRPAPPAHDAAEASVGLCDCPGCLDERRRRMTHPLMARALAAFYDAGDLLHLIQRSHCGQPTTCDLCHDAYMVWSVLAPVECSFEGEYSFVSDPELARRRAESERSRATPPHRRRWRPDASGNFPPLPLAVMAMLDLGKALAELHEGHCDDADCFVCEQARAGEYLAPLLTAQLERTLIPTAALLRRRGVNPGRAKLLRLLEQSERP